MNVSGGPWHGRTIHYPKEATDLWIADGVEEKNSAHHYIKRKHEWFYQGCHWHPSPSFVVFEWPRKPLVMRF